MSDLLWQKPGVKVDARIQAFLAGEDVILDREFLFTTFTSTSTTSPAPGQAFETS